MTFEEDYAQALHDLDNEFPWVGPSRKNGTSKKRNRVFTYQALPVISGIICAVTFIVCLSSIAIANRISTVTIEAQSETLKPAQYVVEIDGVRYDAVSFNLDGMFVVFENLDGELLGFRGREIKIWSTK